MFMTAHIQIIIIIYIYNQITSINITPGGEYTTPLHTTEVRFTLFAVLPVDVPPKTLVNCCPPSKVNVAGMVQVMLFQDVTVFVEKPRVVGDRVRAQ